MKCTELIFDKRSKKFRVCNAEIFGMTGLQELKAYQKHLRIKHKRKLHLHDVLLSRHRSGQ